MLDPWIIEEIRRREDLDQRGDEQPILEIPLEDPDAAHEPHEHDEEQDAPERGVAIVDFRV
jgi:hypothetical protein